MTVTIIVVTWNETYRASMGNTRFVHKGEKHFRRQSDVDRFVAHLQSSEAIEFSVFSGRENRIEDIAVENIVVS